MKKNPTRKDIRNATNNEITAYDHNAKTVELNGELFTFKHRKTIAVSTGIYGANACLVAFYDNDADYYNNGDHILGKVSTNSSLMYAVK